MRDGTHLIQVNWILPAWQKWWPAFIDGRVHAVDAERSRPLAWQSSSV